MVIGEKLHPMTSYVTVKSGPFRRRPVLLHLDYAGLTCDFDNRISYAFSLEQNCSCVALSRQGKSGGPGYLIKA
jgi:hypothetical protein